MSESSETLLAAARAARRERRFEDAVALFDRVLALDPRHLGARIERIGALVQAGRAGEAADDIAALVAEAPDHHDVRLEAGRLARALGRPEEAIAHYEAASAKAAEPGHALVGLAEAAREAGQPARALEAARRATEHMPEAAAAWTALALAAAAAGDSRTERAALRRAADLAPADPAPVLALARATLAGGDAAGAAALFDEAEARSPGARGPVLQRGYIPLAAGDVAMALDGFRRAVARFPAEVTGATVLIHCLIRLGQEAEAEAALAEAEARFGQLPELAAQRAAWLQRQGRADEARPWLRAALDMRAPGRFARWEAWWRQEALRGDASARAACLAEAQPATPAEEAAVARATGQSAEIDLDFDAAARAYDRALELAPADGEAMDGQARLAALRLDHAAARDWLRRQARAEAALRRRQGRGTNPSQTQTGQIATEFQLDVDGSAALRDILPLPPPARLLPLLGVVRALPESTAAALWLLISLRQSGALAMPRGETTIPPRLLWLMPRHAPADGKAAASWTAANPQIAIEAMDGPAALAFLEARHGAAGRRAWLRTREGMVRADLVRLVWLAEVGGWSVPPGLKAVAPLGRLGLGGAAFLAAQGGWGAPDFTLLGAAAGHPVARRAAALAVQALARGDEEIRWLRSGPGLLARAIAGVLAANPGEAAGLHIPGAAAVNAIVAPSGDKGWSADGLV